MAQTATMTLCSTILANNFPFNRIHMLVMFFFVYPSITFFMFCGLAGFEEILEDSSLYINKKSLMIPIGFSCFIFHLNITLKANTEFIDGMYEKLKSKEEYKFILDRLEHSIIIIQNGQIEFANDRFIDQF